MKVAVTAEGTDLHSPVGPPFVRARYFVVIDVDTIASSFRDNTDLQQTTYPAGTQAAGSLISLDVQTVVTANIGPRALATWSSAGVRVFQAKPGSVGEAIDMFQAGHLAELSGPSVEEYWPQSSKR